MGVIYISYMGVISCGNLSFPHCVAYSLAIWWGEVNLLGVSKLTRGEVWKQGELFTPTGQPCAPPPFFSGIYTFPFYTLLTHRSE